LDSCYKIGIDAKREKIKMREKSILKIFAGLWKIVLTIALAVLLFAVFTAIASAATIYVPDDHGTIQDAVDAASPGDTIIVRDGTYTENVDVNKRLTIRSENGPANCIVQAANPNDHVFEVTADYNTISGFTVKGATGYCIVGIGLIGADNCIISDNKVSNNYYGIGLYDSNDNTLTSNTASNNEEGVLLLSQSNGNTLTDNIASNNGIGIRLSEPSDNTLSSNTANSNTDVGIFLGSSNGNKLTGNTASHNNEGIWLGSSSGNTLTSNTADSNNLCGFALFESSDNTLTSNTASNNEGGIHLYDSSNNALTGNTANSNNECGISLVQDSNSNTLTDNTANSNNDNGICLTESSGNKLTSNTVSNNDNGIYLYSSSNNKIYINNFISNTNNVHPDGSNDWNSPSKITYTYKGRTYRNYLGNYWDDYTDVDANNDGIWDNPYSINSDNDDYPLVGRIENHEIAPYYVHDMAITDVYADPSPPTVGQSATIYVTVTNEGDHRENNVPVTVKAYVGLGPFGRQVGSTRVSLSAGESTKESFTWTPSMAKTYYIKGEVGVVSGETDTSDNEKRISVSVQQQNQPPTCAIELRKQGTTTPINEIKVGEFFDIYVGDSTDDQGIKEVSQMENGQNGIIGTYLLETGML
jgi:parallel beta-helix repeat protein